MGAGCARILRRLWQEGPAQPGCHGLQALQLLPVWSLPHADCPEWWCMNLTTCNMPVIRDRDVHAPWDVAAWFLSTSCFDMLGSASWRQLFEVVVVSRYPVKTGSN